MDRKFTFTRLILIGAIAAVASFSAAISYDKVTNLDGGGCLRYDTFGNEQYSTGKDCGGNL